MNIRIISFITFLIVVFYSSIYSSFGLTGEFYRWTDKNGTVHMTDYPPPEGSSIISTSYAKPIEPQLPKTASQIRASRELEEMEIRFRADNRRAEKMQMRLQIKLLSARGYPANSVEADKLRKSYAEDLYNQALSRNGEEKIAILNEYIQMQGEIADIGAIYKYEKVR